MDINAYRMKKTDMIRGIQRTENREQSRVLRHTKDRQLPGGDMFVEKRLPDLEWLCAKQIGDILGKK